MKKMLLLTLLTFAIPIISYKNEMGMETIYPETGIVIDVDYEEDLVTFEVFNGNQFSFYGTEEWYEGDIVSAIIYNNLTKNSVYDDKILSVNYSGYIY